MVTLKGSLYPRPVHSTVREGLESLRDGASLAIIPRSLDSRIPEGLGPLLDVRPLRYSSPVIREGSRSFSPSLDDQMMLIRTAVGHYCPSKEVGKLLVSHLEALFIDCLSASGLEEHQLHITLRHIAPGGPEERTHFFHLDFGKPGRVLALSTIVGSEGTLYMPQGSFDQERATLLAREERLYGGKWLTSLCSAGGGNVEYKRLREERELDLHALADPDVIQRIEPGELGIFHAGSDISLLHASEINRVHARLLVALGGINVYEMSADESSSR